MKFIFSLIFTVFFLAGFAQFEMPKRLFKVNAITRKNPNTTATPSLERSTNSNEAIKYESTFFKNDATWKSISKLPNVSDLNSTPKEAPRNPAELFEKKFNKNDGVVEERFKSDSFLGEFRTGSKTIRIGCRDHEVPDGDMVRVWVNGKVVENAITLQSDFRELFLSLTEGFNVIEFEALNQGESGPNTAQFVMFDDKSKLITSNVWNLTTGVKAKVIIVKQASLLTKKE